MNIFGRIFYNLNSLGPVVLDSRCTRRWRCMLFRGLGHSRISTYIPRCHNVENSVTTLWILFSHFWFLVFLGLINCENDSQILKHLLFFWRNWHEKMITSTFVINIGVWTFQTVPFLYEIVWSFHRNFGHPVALVPLGVYHFLRPKCSSNTWNVQCKQQRTNDDSTFQKEKHSPVAVRVIQM
jgi:hypothetical protein